MNTPTIGQEIYLPSSMSISNGSNDMVGGLATISKIEDRSGNLMIQCKEFPDEYFSWNWLAGLQEQLAQQFGHQRAYPDPDIDTPWIQEGDIVNGKKYSGPPIW